MGICDRRRHECSATMGLEVDHRVTQCRSTVKVSVGKSRNAKLGTSWEGVSIDTMLADVKTDASYAMARSYGDYTTNLPLKDLRNGQAWIAFRFDNKDLAPEHGGPARLLVPHLYVWKSAKWVKGLTLMSHDKPGFWESLGYHIYGDPWREQRYSGDD